MNDRSRHAKDDHVLAGVKAKPYRWPTASPDPDSGRGRHAADGTGSDKIKSLRFQGIATGS